MRATCFAPVSAKGTERPVVFVRGPCVHGNRSGAGLGVPGMRAQRGGGCGRASRAREIARRPRPRRADERGGNTRTRQPSVVHTAMRRLATGAALAACAAFLVVQRHKVLPPAVGSTAPDFTVLVHTGESFTLSARSKRTLLWFYPIAGTAG